MDYLDVWGVVAEGNSIWTGVQTCGLGVTIQRPTTCMRSPMVNPMVKVMRIKSPRYMGLGL
jgi:hypothetical protein